MSFLFFSSGGGSNVYIDLYVLSASSLYGTYCVSLSRIIRGDYIKMERLGNNKSQHP